MKLTYIKETGLLRLDEASEQELEQLNISLTRRIDNWRFNPLVKRGVWDGNISFFHKNKWIPGGLWKEVHDIANSFNYECKINGITNSFDKNIEREEFEKWAEGLFEGHPQGIKPRDYQVDAAYKILKFKRCLAELATSAGKTLITYLVIAYMIEHDLLSGKTLMVVPNVSLVVQAADDFDDYNWDNRIPIKIQQVYSGKKPKPNANIVIGTFQSLVKNDKDWFEIFDAVIGDEVHRAGGKSFKTVYENCNKATYRFGLSGTIPKKGTLDRLTIMSQTGPVITEVAASKLQKEGYVTPCEIKIVQMRYATHEHRVAFSELYNEGPEGRKKLFQLEKNFIHKSDCRLDFVTKVILSGKNNSLVLFHSIEYGNRLYDNLRQNDDKQTEIYYVDGGTDANTREIIKKKMEKGDRVIVIASYGTFSTGISVKNIHNIYFTESFKSEVIIRQSIGRGLRQHKSKKKVNIIDFVDDFSMEGYFSYHMKHSYERRKIYAEQKFPYDVKIVDYNYY